MHLPIAPRKFRSLVTVFPAAFALLPAPAVCAPQEPVNRRDFGIGGFVAPPRWEVQPPDRATYPQLLAWASRDSGEDRSVMTLVAKRLMPNTSVMGFASQSTSLREHAGARDIRLSAQTIDGWSGQRAQLDGLLIERGRGRSALVRERIFRQIFFIHGQVGFVLTLVAPRGQAQPRLRDLEDTFASLIALEPEEQPRRKESEPKNDLPKGSEQRFTPATPGDSPR